MDSGTSENLNEDNLVFQNETITYEKAYTLNNCPLVDIFDLADVVSLVLSEILRETDKSTDFYVTVFHSKKVPGISIRDYLVRIIKCSKCSEESLVLALIYIDRLTERNKKFIIKSLNIHRLLITAVMLAAKFFDDQFYNNEYYARVGGIANKEINVLEVEFLNLINFSLHVHPILFFKYRQRLLAQAKQATTS